MCTASVSFTDLSVLGGGTTGLTLLDGVPKGSLRVDLVALVDPVAVDVDSGTQVVNPAVVLRGADATLQRAYPSISFTIHE